MKLEKKIYANPEEKRKDFFTGIGIFVGVNVILYLIGAILGPAIEYAIPEAISIVYAGLWFILPLVINILLLLYFSLTRSQIALGMLAAFGALLALGLIAAAACFVLIELTL